MNFRRNLRSLGHNPGQGGRSWFRRPWFRGAVVVATAGVLGTLGLELRSQRAAAPEPPAPQVTEVFGGPLWLVAAEGKQPLTAGQKLAPQDGLVLENGRLQITWPDGTIARLEGPTAWRWDGAQQATLQDGRMLVVASESVPPKQWRFPGGQAVVAAGGVLFLDVARDRTVRLAQLEGESRVFRPEQSDRPELRLGSASQLTVRADGRWETPTFLVPGAIARLLGSTVLLEGFGRKLAPLALREAPAFSRPAVSVRPAPVRPPVELPPAPPAEPLPVEPPPAPPPAAVWEEPPLPVEPEPPRVPTYLPPSLPREPAPPPLVPRETVPSPQPKFAPPVVEPLPVEELPPATVPSEPVNPEPAATETF